MLVFNVTTYDGTKIQIPVDQVEALFRADDGTEKGMILGCFNEGDEGAEFKLVWPSGVSKINGFHPSISESIQDVVYADGFYDFYIGSKKWRKKRLKRLRLDDFRCARCGSEMNVQVHHLNYENIGQEDICNDLVTLCKKCHSEIHDKGEI